ncbi:hypothetical protein SEPCBS57363_003915 [Sporothrix epigloea]|uniref:Uncharacterized protein n=1 Tax=Sporothrix epigloea TaxID=1892477 RepID=A0ABP0DSW5_9PEZI
MALWLFRRKSRPRRNRSGPPANEIATSPRKPLAPSGAVAGAGPISSPPIRRRPNSRRRPESDELQGRMRNYSFDSGHVDKLKTGGASATSLSPNQCAAKRAAISPTPDGSDPSNIAKSREAAPIDSIPTLHHSSSKRDGGHLLSRTGNSKRRKNAHDREREAEIKAMGSKTFCNPSINIAEKEIAKPHLNSLAARYTRELGNRRSNVSLPLADSIDSAMPFDTEPVAYVISPFAALTPKPTLRYAAQSQSGPFNFGLFPIRKTSRRKRLATPLPESVLRANSLIDDLAQDMNASDLRELMERDARRRDRRRLRDEEPAAYISDQQKTSQGFLKKQQPQKLKDQQSVASCPSTPASGLPELRHEVLGRETVGHEVDTTSTIAALPIGLDSDSQSMTPRHKLIEPGLHPPQNRVDPLQPSSESFPAPSRLQSPEAQPPLPTEPVLRHMAAQHIELQLPTEQNSNVIDEKYSNGDDDESISSTPTGYRRDPQLHSSYDSASMSNVMTNATRDDTPMSWLKKEESEPSLELQQSLSLASIDSEGSWFSGRTASRRGISHTQPSLDRVSQLQHQYKTVQGSRHDRLLTKTEPDISSDRQDLSLAEFGKERAPASYISPEEDDDSSIVMDDEYLNRLTRSSAGTDSLIDIHCESMGDLLPSSDEEFETGNGVGDDTWGSVSEKHRGSRILTTRKSNFI